jgi:hypothetical protein
MFVRRRRINKPAAIMAVPSVFLLLVSIFGFSSPVQATFSTLSQISDSQAFLQGQFAEVGVRPNGAFGSTSVPSGFHQNSGTCLGFRVDRAFDGWDNPATTDDGDFFCPGSPFEGWQMKVGSNLAKNDNGTTGISGAVSNLQTSGSSQCVSWNSATAYNGVSISQRYCVPTDGQALHTDVTISNTSGAAIDNIYFGRGFDPDDYTGTGTVPLCNGVAEDTNMFQSCNAVTGQGTEAQATARWGNGAFIALQSFDARARVARQTGGFSSPDPSEIWTAGDTSATTGTYRGDIGEFSADAGLYVALSVPTLGAGATTSFRVSYVLSSEGNKAPVLGAPIASGISQTTAHVSSTINPKGFSTTANLVYSTSSTFSNPTTVSIGTFTGSDELTFDVDMPDITPSTTYYAKVVATNEKGTTESSVFQITTLAASAPTVTSEDPTIAINDGPVTLSGTLNPNGFAATATFQYSTTPDFSGTVVDIPVSGDFTGTSPSTVSTVVSSLNLTTTYYFRLKVTNASGSAYGSTISFVNADLVAPTSLVVTSLDDNTSSGTLRWAITQANATTGGIYDAITFGVDGTISLGSALPQITQNLTVTGNGRTQTIIDGQNLYRPFNVASGKSLTVSNMTLKQGQATNGGLIYNGSGTVVATNIRFTAMAGGSAVFNNNSWSTATYTNCTFDYLNTGIAGDYGDTPQLPSDAANWADTHDYLFNNKTYVDNCIFTNNTYGIKNYRFTKVVNSQFATNSYGASITGLNRSQVLNSTFTSNGIGIYHNSWMTVGNNYGTNNRLITGNTFNSNGVAIYLDDTWNNARKNQGWSTVTGNTWDASGVWVRYYQWDGTTNAQFTARPYTTGTAFAQSTNTFPDTIGAPSNLTATDTGSGILLDWDAPASGGYSPERYAITWSGSLGGGGIATGNVGGATALDTSILISYATIYSFGVAGETFPFHIRSDNDTFSKYSANSNTVSMQVGASATTTSSVPDVPLVPGVPTEIVLPEIPTTTILETLLPEILEPIVISTTIPPEVIVTIPSPSPESTVPVDEPIDIPELPEVGEPIATGDLEDILDTIFTPDASTEEITAVLDGLLDAKLTGKQFDAVVDATLGSLEEPDADVGAVVDSFLEADLTDKEFTKVLDAVFSEDVSDEVFTEALTTMIDADLSDKEFDKVLDAAFSETTSPEAMVSALSSIFDGPASGEDISKVMGAVFDEDISVADTMTVLGDLLETNLSASEAEAVFDNVFDSDLSDAETIDLIVDVLKDGLTAELLGSVLGAVFDEEVSTEVLIETFTAVLDGELNAESIGVIVDVLESDTITSEQVGQVVTLVIEQEGGIESGQATELATSAKVLESIDGEQALAVFAAIVVSEVSAESGAAIAEALVEAPTEVKESFEEEINVFAGVFDTYEPLGSTINVGQRRSVIAVNLVTSTVALAAAAGAIPTPGSSPSAPRQDVAVRKEEEQEEGGAIEGEGPDWIKRISIYKYEDGVRVMDWKNFTRKFVYGILASGFTLAGATVMYFTLSGLTQQIALWGTILAFTGSMYLHMKEPDSE